MWGENKSMDAVEVCANAVEILYNIASIGGELAEIVSEEPNIIDRLLIVLKRLINHTEAIHSGSAGASQKEREIAKGKLQTIGNISRRLSMIILNFLTIIEHRKQQSVISLHHFNHNLNHSHNHNHSLDHHTERSFSGLSTLELFVEICLLASSYEHTSDCERILSKAIRKLS